MTGLAFLGALSLTVLVYEILSAFQGQLFGRNRLFGVEIHSDHIQRRRTTWEAVLIALFPNRFDPSQARGMANVVDMLRRAGYPYDTPGDFYAAAIRDFTQFLAIGGLLAGALVVLDMGFVSPVMAAIFIVPGLRRPYTRLKLIAKKRAEGMRNNMLIGLAVMESMLTAGVGVQEALRRTAGVGGPFCNLLGLLVAQIEVKDISNAVGVAQAHLPDPNDVEANLFLSDILDFFTNSRPILSSVQALRISVHRSVVETTEARAALVRQRSGLFGVFAVLGLVLAIILPYMGVAF